MITRPTREEFLRLAAVHAAVPVVRELTADTVTPTGMLLRLTLAGRHAFLLESVEGGERVARWSFAGNNPARVVTVRDGAAAIDGMLVNAPPIETLRAHLVGRDRAPLPELPPFCGGAVGWLGYDAVRLLERLPTRLPDPLGLPEAWFGVYPAIAALDRARQRLLLVATAVPGGGDPGAAYDDARARLLALEAMLAPPLDEARPAALPLPRGVPQPDESWHVAPADERFLETVRLAREEIRAGEAFQIVLSQRFEMASDADALDVYRVLRVANPSPYMYLLRLDGFDIVGSSPEALVTVKDGRALLHPIAGTRWRGATPQEDAQLGEELLADDKERAEHLMLVDLGRNDLGRVCVPGTVEVVDFMSVRRYSHVMHLESTVQGRLEPGRTALDALLACFPAGTLSGAPKVRAMQIVERLETSRRGLYGGVVGYLDVSGDLDAAIAIRTAVLAGSHVWVQAGAGIVADSDPVAEDAECRAKAMAVLRAATVAATMCSP